MLLKEFRFRVYDDKSKQYIYSGNGDELLKLAKLSASSVIEFFAGYDESGNELYDGNISNAAAYFELPLKYRFDEAWLEPYTPLKLADLMLENDIESSGLSIEKIDGKKYIKSSDILKFFNKHSDLKTIYIN